VEQVYDFAVALVKTNAPISPIASSPMTVKMRVR
jgi:hypothetical protein